MDVKKAESITRLGFVAANVLLIISSIVVAAAARGDNPLAFWGAVGVAIGGGAVFILGILGERYTRKEIALSHEAAAEASAQVAKAHLEIERLRRLTAWRRLGAAQRQAIQSVLNAVPAASRTDIWLTFVGDDIETAIYREDLNEVFNASGFETSFFSGYNAALGLAVSNANTPTGSAICSAFRAAQIEFSCTDEDLPVRISPSGAVEVRVGTRPPPPEANINY